jgi:hypothetical protein
MANADLSQTLGFLAKLAQNIKGLDAKKALAAPVEAMKARVFGLNKGRDGQDIGEYSPATKAQKREKGKKSNRVTLTESGRLKQSLRVIGAGKSAKLVGVGYAAKLQAKYDSPMSLNKQDAVQYLKNIAAQVFE